jgi:hypothetical protein
MNDMADGATSLFATLVDGPVRPAPAARDLWQAGRRRRVRRRTAVGTALLAAAVTPTVLAVGYVGAASPSNGQVRLANSPSPTSSAGPEAWLEDGDYSLVDSQSGASFTARFYQSAQGLKVTVTVQAVEPGFADQDAAQRDATPVQVDGKPGYSAPLGDRDTYLAWSESPTTLVTVVATGVDRSGALEIARHVTVDS